MSRLDHTKRDEQLVQQAFLDAFPNPDRLGCPGYQVIRSIAEKKIQSDDAVRRHMRRCSNCSQDLFTFRKQWRALKIRRFALMATAATLLIVFGLFGYTRPWQEHPETAMLTFVEGGSNRGTESDAKEQSLPKVTRHLSLLLPLDSEPGHYELEIREGVNPEHPLLSYPATAKEEPSGSIVLRSDVDLSTLKPDHYVLAWRRHGDANWSRGLIDLIR